MGTHQLWATIFGIDTGAKAIKSETSVTKANTGVTPSRGVPNAIAIVNKPLKTTADNTIHRYLITRFFLIQHPRKIDLAANDATASSHRNPTNRRPGRLPRRRAPPRQRLSPASRR